MTVEQTARALNALCRAWLARRSGRPRVAHVASVIRYQQARNRAARASRQRQPPKRE